MPNPDGTIDVRVVLYVRVDPLAWAESMMDKPTTKTNVIRDSVKEFVRDHIANLPLAGEDLAVVDVWLGVGQ